MGNTCCKQGEFGGAEVELSNFNLLRSVGKGAFGKVRVVQHKASKLTYALKYINKEKCMQMSAVENIIEERNLLEKIHNAFICNLRYSFQDDENMFMILDLMLGGDLRFHLDRLGTFSVAQMQLIVAECCIALDYLHSRKIIHRDMKPDNILLCENGHAHLADFNIAVRFREDKPLTAVAGSMAYMAPEILSKKGYFSSIDHWSLGVIVYEMATSKRPFRAKTNEGLTNAILHDEIPFDQLHKVDEAWVDLIKQFLERDVKKRIGVKETGGFETIKNHAAFKGLQWDLVAEKKVTPPFIPDSKKANFDATHELEELLLEDNPLKAKPRRRKGEKTVPPPNETPEERAVRLMEEEFHVFDWTKIDRVAAEKALAEAEIVDLCEKEGYKPAIIEDKTGNNSVPAGLGNAGSAGADATKGA